MASFLSSSIRGLVSKKKKRFQEDGFVSEKIIIFIFMEYYCLYDIDPNNFFL